MRIAIVYPPFTRNGAFPLLPQNRQFKYTASPEVKIYPVVPASAATILNEAGHHVLFLDGINRRLGLAEFNRLLLDFAPELVVMETKAPLIRSHWEYVKWLKQQASILTALVGDHVTFFPEESFQHCTVDFCVTGGDYDMALGKLVEHLEGRGAMPAGVYYRKGEQVENTGAAVLTVSLDSLPFIDRDLTRWQDYGEAYLHHPCAYIMSGRGCSNPRRPGVCTFCIWQHSLWQRSARLRSPSNVAAEIDELVNRYEVREIFDDNESGPTFDPAWLREFSTEMRARKLIGRVMLSTNARADCLTDEVCGLLKESGFRLLKVGLESGNDATLKRLGKLETVQQIREGVRTAKDHGLIVMLTSMVGYPWETEDEVRQTYEVARELMLYKTRAGDSLQSSVIIPYPGTPLFKEAEREGWLLYGNDYDKYDMSRPVLKTTIDTTYWCRKMWRVHYEPVFLLKTFLSIRSLSDISLLLRGVKSLLGHLKDYSALAHEAEA